MTAFSRKRFSRASGTQIGARTTKVRVCENCDVWAPPGSKPPSCPYCGHMAFTTFDSQGECGRWNTLRLLERQGTISNLRRQVRMDLMAAREIDGRTVAVKVGQYVADFTYTRDGEDVIEDFKGSAMTDVAALKLRWMAGMGKPVRLTSG